MSRLRWGLLSTARINERIIDAVHRSDRSELVAVASRDAQRAKAYAECHDIPSSYGTYEELANSSEVDAVYISLPNHLHAEWAVRLCEAGKHVLCEKPLTLSLVNVDRMAQAAQEAGVVLQEASATRFHRQTSDIAQIVSSGRLGRIVFCHATFEFTLPAVADIRLNTDMGGGAMWDVGCYPVAFFQAVLRENPISAYARAVIGPTGIDLAFSGFLGYESGTAVQFTVSMATPMARSARIVGELGSLELDQPWLTNMGAPTTVRQQLMRSAAGAGTFGDDPDQLEVSTWDYGPSDVYFDEVRGFEELVLDGAQSPCTLSDSRMNVQVIMALHEAARTGREVSIGSPSPAYGQP
jgi:predicted dehydrogenase